MDKLIKDKENEMIFGVCSGFAKYTNTDPIWWRLAFIIGAFIFLVPMGLVYFIFSLIMPEN